MLSDPPYVGLADADRLRWAIVLLTGDQRVAVRLSVEHTTSRPLASGDRAIRLIRKARRRRLLATAIGLGRPRARVHQRTFGRQRLADTLGQLPFQAQVAVVMVDACGIPPAEVAFAIGCSRRRIDRALRRARSKLASAVALPPTLETLAGSALRGVQAAALDVDGVRSSAPAVPAQVARPAAVS